MKQTKPQARISWAQSGFPGFHPIERQLARAEKERKRLLELALKEAEALAWQSGVPELLFVTLAEEKVDQVNAWLARQEQLYKRRFEWALAE